MYEPIYVYKNRTNIITVNLGTDVSSEVYTSQIRTQPYVESDLLATWIVSFATDGTDGMLVLTLDDSTLVTMTHTTGFMDLKRVSGGEPFSVFEDPIPVVFKGTVTQ